LENILQQDPDSLPTEPISREQPRIIWVILYGLLHWHDLFNPRQLLSLITLSRKLKEVYASIQPERGSEYAAAVTTYLALAVDRLANQGSTLSRWNNRRETLEGVFARQAIPLVWDYAEFNPFSGSAGDWSGALDWVARVIEHCSATSDKGGTVHQGTATRLSYPDESIDAIITDPPYYDAIPYSHLSDFFYVWLKRSVGFLYPDLFRSPLTPKGAEIVEQRRHKSLEKRKDKAFYETELTKAFSEARRVLKKGGVFVVVFAHKSIAAWETLLSSLLTADLVTTASWPLHTEMSSRMIAHGTASLFVASNIRRS
jgi:putative DNA methylase